LQVSAKFSRLIGIGAALLILTGFGMMILTKGVFGQQGWFRIKFGLVILLIGSGEGFGSDKPTTLYSKGAENILHGPGVTSRFQKPSPDWWFMHKHPL
jgi:hypothetical protein